jgi:hypothetical protein
MFIWEFGKYSKQRLLVLFCFETLVRIKSSPASPRWVHFFYRLAGDDAAQIGDRSDGAQLMVMVGTPAAGLSPYFFS